MVFVKSSQQRRAIINSNETAQARLDWRRFRLYFYNQPRQIGKSARDSKRRQNVNIIHDYSQTHKNYQTNQQTCVFVHLIRKFLLSLSFFFVKSINHWLIKSDCSASTHTILPCDRPKTVRSLTAGRRVRWIKDSNSIMANITTPCTDMPRSFKSLFNFLSLEIFEVFSWNQKCLISRLVSISLEFWIFLISLVSLLVNL